MGTWPPSLEGGRPRPPFGLPYSHGGWGHPLFYYVFIMRIVGRAARATLSSVEGLLADDGAQGPARPTRSTFVYRPSAFGTAGRRGAQGPARPTRSTFVYRPSASGRAARPLAAAARKGLRALPDLVHRSTKGNGSVEFNLHGIRNAVMVRIAARPVRHPGR